MPRGLVVLALVLTAVAGPLGRPAAEHDVSEQVFRPVVGSSSIVGAAAR